MVTELRYGHIVTFIQELLLPSINSIISFPLSSPNTVNCLNEIFLFCFTISSDIKLYFIQKILLGYFKYHPPYSIIESIKDLLYNFFLYNSEDSLALFIFNNNLIFELFTDSNDHMPKLKYCFNNFFTIMNDERNKVTITLETLKNGVELMRNFPDFVQNPQEFLQNITKLMQNIPSIMENPLEFMQNIGGINENPSEFIQTISSFMENPPEFVKNIDDLMITMPEWLKNIFYLVQNILNYWQNIPCLVQNFFELVKNNPNFGDILTFEEFAAKLGDFIEDMEDFEFDEKKFEKDDEMEDISAN